MAVRDEGTVENQGPPKETKVENKVGSEDFVQQLKIFSLNSDSVAEVPADSDYLSLSRYLSFLVFT